MSSSDQTTPVKCSLCGFKYKRGEIEKMLPLKMLFELKSHMGKRKRNLPDLFPPSQIVAEEFLMHACRICTLCYELVVRENQLIVVI